MTAMEDRRVVVTGATSGIGKEIARALVARGAEVVLACRDAERGNRTAQEISAGTSRPEPSVMVVDTADQTSIRRFADLYGRRHGSLDVLVNNAGVLRPQREISVDGHELTLATNVLGYHLMTRELLDALRAGTAARVVNVASTYAGDVDLDDLPFQRRPYDGMRAYAQSKACDRLLTWSWARRLEADGITANAVAPGLVLESALYRDVPDEIRRYLEQQPSRSLTEGADTAVWLAGSPDVGGLTGRFFERRTEIECAFRDLDTEQRLWGICQAMTDHAAVPAT